MDNFDWVNDLKELLGNAADYVPGVSSFDELARGDWGGAATAPFASVGGLYSLGQATVKENLGGLVGSTKALGSLIGNDPEEARRLLRQSGRDTWEETVPNTPLPVQAALELGTDPFNFITGPMSAAASTAVRAGIPGAGPVGRTLLPAVATGIEGFNVLNNTLPERAVDATLGRGVRAGKRAIESRFPTAFEYSPRARVNRSTNDTIRAFDEFLMSRGQQFRGMKPAVLPTEDKSLAPVDEYTAPPFFDRDFDRGVPASLKQRAWEAHQRLSARNQSFPDIPGINAAGMSSPEESGAAWWNRAKEFTQDPNNPLSRIYKKKELGFIPPPAGGYKTPEEAAGNIDEDNLRDMAEIGAAAIADFDNMWSNDMFRGLRRANKMRWATQAIARKYGEGINPFVPAAYEEMKRLFNYELPDVRFLTAWGWAGGRTPDKKLQRIQRKLDNQEITLDQAYAEIQKGFSKGSPQIIEEAAAMGAGRLIADLPDTPPEGVMSPLAGEFASPGIDPATRRAAIPSNFEDRFAKNREAYATYMRQLFGEIPDDEMEVLRRLSIEVLYDEMMNAAAPVSGGRGGATALMKGRTGSGEEGTKIGAIPGDDPSNLGNRIEDIARLIPETQRGMRPTTKALNRAEYKEITGREAPRGWNNKKLFQEVRKEGGTGFTDNPKGGFLPNTRKLLQYYDVGKNVLQQSGAPEDWYQDAVDEVIEIVGPGRYEDAMMLIELLAVTSSGTGVEQNAKNAIRAFAEWKLGSDDAIRNGLGLSAEEVETLLNRQGRWVGVREMLQTVDPKTGKPRSELAYEPGDELFMGAMAANQKKEAGRLFETYVERKMAQESKFAGPGDTGGGAYAPTQAGPKTNNFAGSFVVRLWKDSVSYAMEDGPLKDKVLKALDDAMQVYTLDRHISRTSHGSTAVTPMSAIANREAALIAAKELPDVRPEDFQSGIWYYSKSRQGFLSLQRDDDMASMLRKAWNDKIDLSRNAEFRARAREELGADASEAEISQLADDLVRQEAVIAIVKEQLDDALKSSYRGTDAGRNIASRILRTDNPMVGLFELGHDTLGIINRTNKGVVPRRSVSPTIPSLVTNAEEQLRAIRSGRSQGATWKWDGDTWVESPDTSGFAVALDSAGRSLSTAKPKTAARATEEFLGGYADLLDEPGVAENIRFGIWPFDSPEQASFDLGVVVPDEATAVSLARRFNQKSIYEIATGRTIDTGGTGDPIPSDPDDIRALLESLFGPATGGPTESVREVIRRGATVSEMDSVNPVSILMRKVIRPMMDRYAERSAEVLPKKTAQTQTPGGGVLEDYTFGTDEIDFEAIGQEPLISTQANTVLNQSIEGETYKTRLTRYFDEATEDTQYLQSTGIRYGPDLTLDERLAVAGDDTRAAEIIKKYDKEGIDVAYSDPRAITASRIRKDIAKTEGIDPDSYSTWDLIRAAWGEQVLFTPKYLLGNLQGAWVQNAFGGVFRTGTPSEFLAAFKLERGGRTEVERKAILNNLVSFQIAQKWGFDELPAYLQRGGIRSQTSSRNRASGSAMGELTYRITRNKKVGRAVGKPFKAQADLSQSIETVMRGSLWASTLDREMTAAMSVVEDSINAMAVHQGLDTFEFSILNNINPVPGGPSPKRLKEHLMDLGFAEGYAERAGRNFAEAKNIAERVAKAEVDKRQFSYDRTNLDEFVGKFIPFHYWFSRAVPYYFEESLRHPIVAISYMRANEGIEAAQDDPGLSARQKGFLRVMGTPLGFSLLVNPDALMGVVRIFGLDSSYTPDGETEAGGVVSWLKNRGLGLYPWIDGTLNLLGAYGDTFEPDLLGIRHKSLIGSAVNFVASQAGMEPPGSPYQELMGELRYRVSSLADPFTPDWMFRPVLPKAGGSQSDATLDTVIESRIMARNPQLTNGELLEIITDPEHPEYIAAYQDAATAGIIQQLVNITTPINVRMREDSRDVRNAQISTIYEAAEEAGVSPQEFQPSMGDIEFATRYKNLTGNDWKPGDFDSAMAKAELAKATPQAKPFVYEEQQYHSLGTPEQRAVFQRYQDLRNGNAPETRVLPERERIEIAEMWVDASGHRGIVSEMYTLRDAFEKTHPTFGEFKAWQSQMFNLSANLGGSLSEYRRRAIAENPNAREYFRKMIEDVREENPPDWAAEIEKRTTNAEAWQAIFGKTRDRQDPAPVPGAVPFDVTLPQMETPFLDQGYGGSNLPWVGQVADMYGYSGY